MANRQASSLTSFDTGYSADSTEFCPFPGYEQYLACGTYQLADDNDTKVRRGKLYLFTVDSNADTSLTQQQTLITPAILDMKWSHALIGDQPTLGVVDSVGGLQLYSFNTEKRLAPIYHLQVTEDTQILALSLDWASRVDRSCRDVVISHSDGFLSIVAPTESQWIRQQHWQAHDLEAWIAAYDYWNTNIVYSGADDCLFKGWDTRSENQIFQKRHMMGVTTMQSSPLREHVLATGSYDENISLWDTRSMRRPVSTIQTEGGGIWRLKWHPTEANKLLSASMHAGAFVIDVDAELNPSITTSFLDHTSMAYGADWSYAPNSHLVASCSFYDHVMHLWDADRW
ncbi:WD repeat-containing protein 85-like protein [Radiomyces spectabilis]|uniref:WD repeat-containing protein 85-like protein n=1 Tax=Radiomyces spectabilis TaxID=64574 RepID=UPI00221ECF97|nr:WD repeat-containing protein 85-like protein [Radiomyces spectabilis]KAI8376475.1 WD repeat-containing protein 85-like protein [Radiomyces spectabilis]